MPFLVRWPARVTAGVSDALVSQVDFVASFAALTAQTLATGEAPDSHNVLPALLGKAATGRDKLVEHDGFTRLAFRDGQSKYLEPGRRAQSTEGGELYKLDHDLSETNNLHETQRELARRLAEQLTSTRNAPVDGDHQGNN